MMPFGEIKFESRRNPVAFYKLMEIASKRALEVFHYNVFGHEFNPAIKHSGTNSQAKKVREFFAKNNVIKAFLKGFDRKDEKILMSVVKTIELDTGERLVKKGTTDRCIFMVA